MEEKSDMKRSSQIVFHSGFINRLADAPSNFHQAHSFLSKGWKPYKVELKGSKMYFYKPPGDRTAAVKELFPTTLVPPSEEDTDEVDSERVEASDDVPLRKGKAKEGAAGTGTIGRKKRTFWGRRTHPDLIMNPNGIIEKGTFESLVHEAVFATTFFDAGDFDKKQEADNNRKRWHEFASSVLFSIPSIVDRQAFELEFTRCCSYLVSGAEDETKDVQRTSVTWLANEYLTYHGQPVVSMAWDQWKQETIPGASLTAEMTATYSSGLPMSSSTQAIHHPSPLMNNSSPNINTFSPRPEDNPQMLLDSFFPLSPTHDQQQQHSRTSSRPILSSPSIRFPWVTLNEEGLSKDLLFMLDPYLIAHSLTLYHRSILDQCPENLTTEFITSQREEIGSSSSPLANEEMNNGFINISASSSSSSSFSSNSLFGSEDRPHWLTKLLLLQILGSETTTTTTTGGQHNPCSPNNNNNHHQQLASPVRRSEDRGSSQTSRTHSRSEVISIWTKVGEICRLAGDECSWRAISAALCSRPISRLEKTWKRVDPQAISAVETWATQHVVVTTSDNNNKESGGGGISVGQPQVTPWGGDVKIRIVEELGKARGDNGGVENSMINTACIIKVRSLFDRFRTSFLLCPRKSRVLENEISDDARRLAAYWRDLAVDGGGVSSLAMKFRRYVFSFFFFFKLFFNTFYACRLEQFMSLSLATEPRRKGLFEPYFWTRSIHTHTSYTSLIPLLFPDPLPTLTLVNRSKLVRGRLESDTSEMQYLRSVDAQLRQEAGRNLHHNLNANQDYIKRLILGMGGTVISLYNGNLRLVVQSGTFETEPGNTSRPSSNALSRPPSSLVDHGGGGGNGGGGGGLCGLYQVHLALKSRNRLASKGLLQSWISLPLQNLH